MAMKKLAGKVALVTGAGRNLGRAIALRLADEGADIVIHVNKSLEAGESVADEIRALGREAYVFSADLLAPDSVIEMFATIRNNLGRNIHILVNNAAIRPRQNILDITTADWDRVLSTNLRAPFICAQQVLPGMIEEGYGRIVNISGADAVSGLPMRAHNIASKTGLVGLTRAIAHDIRELAGGKLTDITCNAILPGVLDTKRVHENYPHWAGVNSMVTEYPIPRVGRVEEVAGFCAFLASSDASYMTGQTITVDGGATIHPWFRA